MKRLAVATVAIALVLPAAAAGQDDAAPAPDPSVTEPFMASATGSVVAGPSGSFLLLDVDDAPAGDGAASLTLRPTLGGSLARGTVYDAEGSIKLRFVFKAGAPAPDGTRTLAGTGTFFGGSGAYKRARGRFTVTGSRSPAGVDTLAFDGRVRHDRPVEAAPPSRSARGQ